MNFPKPSVGMLPGDRIAYSPIVNRKPLKLPNKARMAVWVKSYGARASSIFKDIEIRRNLPPSWAKAAEAASA